ncbi:MAG: ABC transporter substrate-binding protein [Pseudomonadota bacterium]
MLNKLAVGAAAVAMVGAVAVETVAKAEDVLYIPGLTYRTGPFAGGGVPTANGFADYFAMLNARDGGIGGVRVEYEECETAYNAQKGVECYESTKGKGALIYNPYSTGITLQLIPKAPVDKIPVLSAGYGLSAAAVGEKFPWTFNYPASYWSQMSSILKYIDSQGGIKDKKIGFIYLDVGYGREPIPLLEQLAPEMGYELKLYPVGVKEMQAQSAQWLNVRKDRPDWMVMWGWGAMTPTAIKEAAKIRFPMDRFIGNWWSAAHADLVPVGDTGTGYLGANYTGIGTDFPLIQDIIKHVVEPGNSQAEEGTVGNVLYNRAVFNALMVAEGIREAQKLTGKKVINGEDMRLGMENINLTEERLKELGLEGFTAPLIGSCADHEYGTSIFLQQWDGKDWKRVSDLVAPMEDVVQPLLDAAAEKYLADKPDWQTQSCG